MNERTFSTQASREEEVKAYMRTVIECYVDLETEEVNTIGLAEDATYHFDAYHRHPNYDVPDDFFDWALDVSEEE